MKNKISRLSYVILILITTVVVNTMPIVGFASPTPSPKATSTSSSTPSPKETTGSKETTSSTNDNKATAKPSEGTDAKSNDSEDDKKSEATATPEPKATKNPRLDEDGRPIMADRECAIMIDTRTDEVLYEQNSDKQIYPASTTKIMTALLTLEAIDRGELNLNSAFKITPDMLEDLAADGSSMQLKEGEAITVQYLLEGLMVESGNDAAQALAIIVCGDIETFVQRMNDKAAELNMSGTHYVNPHGLHDEEHYTTASDLCTLTKVAMKNKTFRSIVSMPQAIIPATDKVGTRTLINTNGLLSTLKYSKYYYANAIGVKTGHTNQAGYCLISAAVEGNYEVIGVVMNCETEDDRHYDSRNMLAYALDNNKAVTAVKKGEMLTEVKVKFGTGADFTTLSVGNNIIVDVPEDTKNEDLELRQNIPSYVAAPVNQGDKVGTIDVVLNGKVVGTGDLFADSAVKRHPLGFLMQFFSLIWGIWIIKVLLIIIAIAFVAFVIYMILNIMKNIKASKSNRKKQASKRTPNSKQQK